MSIYIKRRKGESFEALLRRFSRRVTMSGSIIEKRKIRYHSEPTNKNKKKVSALRGLKIGEKREYLLKTGRLVENNQKNKRQ